MKRNLIITLIAASALILSTNASAREVEGLGIGGDGTIGGAGGLSIWYFTNHIGVQLVVGAEINAPKTPEGQDQSNDNQNFWVALRVTYDIARADEANFFGFIGFNYLMDGISDAEDKADIKSGSMIVIELGLGAFYWFSDHFGIHTEVGIPIRLVGEDGYGDMTEGTYVGIFDWDVFGGAGFVFKF